jgi:hypothetical protein
MCCTFLRRKSPRHPSVSTSCPPEISGVLPYTQSYQSSLENITELSRLSRHILWYVRFVERGKDLVLLEAKALPQLDVVQEPYDRIDWLPSSSRHGARSGLSISCVPNKACLEMRQNAVPMAHVRLSSRLRAPAQYGDGCSVTPVSSVYLIPGP